VGSGSEEWEILRGWKYRRCRDKKCDEVGSERYKEGGKREDAEIKKCEEVGSGDTKREDAEIKNVKKWGVGMGETKKECLFF